VKSNNIILRKELSALYVLLRRILLLRITCHLQSILLRRSFEYIVTWPMLGGLPVSVVINNSCSEELELHLLVNNSGYWLTGLVIILPNSKAS
jgi:hypothetical protein